MGKTFGERLQLAMTARGFTNRHIKSKLPDVKREETVSDWRANRDMPRGNSLVELIRILNVDANWLLLGKGEMEPTEPEDAVRRLLEVRRLVRELQEIAEPTREAAMQAGEALGSVLEARQQEPPTRPESDGQAEGHPPAAKRGRRSREG